MSKEFRHYSVLSDKLSKYVDEKTKEEILKGCSNIKGSSKPEEKAKWAFEITKRIDEHLDEKTAIALREECACLLSNEKSIYAKEFKRLRKAYKNDDDYLNEVVKYLNSTRPLQRCGEVIREGNKIISVIGREKCACTAIREGLEQPISKTWCHCCKGSLLSVYKYVFDDKECDMSIDQTVASGGNICSFITTYR